MLNIESKLISEEYEIFLSISLLDYINESVVKYMKSYDKSKEEDDEYYEEFYEELWILLKDLLFLQ